MAMLSSHLETACGFRIPSERHAKRTDSVPTVFTGGPGPQGPWWRLDELAKDQRGKEKAKPTP